jgi:hypothetical protein
LSYGGIRGFVDKGWAAGDHIHINFKGGARVAKRLSDAIMQRAYDMLVEREGKIVDMVYPLGLSPEGLYKRYELMPELDNTPLIYDVE